MLLLFRPSGVGAHVCFTYQGDDTPTFAYEGSDGFTYQGDDAPTFTYEGEC